MDKEDYGAELKNGMVVSREAIIRLWPYLRTVVNGLNEAPKQETFERQGEAILNVIFQAAAIAYGIVKVKTPYEQAIASMEKLTL